MEIQASRSARWFTRVTWIGVAANLALATPTLLVPERMLALTGLPTAAPILWLQFSALLLILLSAFYVPAALDPNKYRLVAWMAVGARLAGVVFFIGFQPREYHFFGYFDFVFFVPELLLLAALSRDAVRRSQLAGARVSEWRAP
jgi:hypothetical protein